MVKHVEGIKSNKLKMATLSEKGKNSVNCIDGEQRLGVVVAKRQTSWTIVKV